MISPEKQHQSLPACTVGWATEAGGTFNEPSGGSDLLLNATLKRRGGGTHRLNKPLSFLLSCHMVKIGTGGRNGGEVEVCWRGRPGPDNGELSRRGTGAGHIGQIRTDREQQAAAQFCRSEIRRLIVCHPSIPPPPIAVSPAINPLMTSRAARQAHPPPLPLPGSLSSERVAADATGKMGIKTSLEATK